MWSLRCEKIFISIQCFISKTSDELIIRLSTIKAFTCKITFFFSGKFTPRNLGQSSRFRSITDKLSRVFVSVSVNVTSRRHRDVAAEIRSLAKELRHDVTDTDFYACNHSPTRVRRALVRQEYARPQWMALRVRLPVITLVLESQSSKSSNHVFYYFH